MINEGNNYGSDLLHRLSLASDCTVIRTHVDRMDRGKGVAVYE